MNYEEMLEAKYGILLDYLTEKYGQVNGNYFTDKTCKTKNKEIDRWKSDGLAIHHKDEINNDNLSTVNAANKTWHYQTPTRLVWANLLEHAILHFHIYRLRMKDGDCGLSWLVSELNDIYSGVVYKQDWKNKHKELILKEKETYIKLLKKLKEIGYNYDIFISSHWNKYNDWSIDKNKEFFDELKERGL